jgi:hypothetical protein
MYTWKNYDDKLYQYYKNPSENAKFAEKLKETIVEAEGAGKIPPGIYAEYGYVLYEQGNFVEAAEYFQKEHDKWPESQVFMSKMIINANKAQAKLQNK